MPRHVDAVKPDAADVDRKEADQIAADMARGPQRQRHLRIAETAVTFLDQRLLQLAGLDQIAVDRIVERLQLAQRRGELAVLLLHRMFHGQDAFARGQPRPQFVAVHRFRQKIIGAALQPLGDVMLFRLRGEQDEIAIALARHGAEPVAEFDPRHARHHPVGQHEIGLDPGADFQRLFRRPRLQHLVSRARQLRGQDATLHLAVIHHQNPPQRGVGLGNGRRVWAV